MGLFCITQVATKINVWELKEIQIRKTNLLEKVVNMYMYISVGYFIEPS